MTRICTTTVLSCLLAVNVAQALPDRDLFGRLKGEAEERKACLRLVEEAEHDCYDVCEILEANHFSDEEIELCVEECFYHAKDERKRCLSKYGAAPKLSFEPRKAWW